MALMLTSCVAWAQTIATFSGVASTLQPDVNAYRQTMDDLNRFLERESFPQAMRIRLRAYFNASRHLRLAETQRRLLQFMPPSLQGEVRCKTHRHMQGTEAPVVFRGTPLGRLQQVTVLTRL